MRSSLIVPWLLGSSASLASCSVLPSTSPSLSPRHDKLNKPAINPPFSEEVQDRHFRIDFPPRPWRHEVWPRGWLPKSCMEEAEYNHLDPVDFEAVDVRFRDCPVEWTVCRHKKSDQSWISTLDTLSAVPVGMRQYISNLVLLPGQAALPSEAASGQGKKVAAAYTRGAVLVFTPSYFKLGVLFHEITHILDTTTLRPLLVAHGYPVTTSFSETKFWRQAYGNDSAVPTPYSKASWQEDFADAGRWAMSHYTREKGLAEYSRGWMGCRTQIAAFQAWMGDIIFPRGGVCTGKIAGSKAVRVGNHVPGSRPPGKTSMGSFKYKGSSRGTPRGLVKEIAMPQGVGQLVFVYQRPVPDWS